ncbi:MAG: hypothetical protein OXT69_06685 [Candidatus Poribacteria bacterium]|nr:hypothetical protein [Candidatus Poribacteria bacterium]
MMDAEIGYAESVFDFTAAFEGASVENSPSAEASMAETSGGETTPGIFLHPPREGDARVEFQAEFPTLASGERLYLVFALGLRDGVKFDEPDIHVDGVLCGVELNGVRFFEAVVDQIGWRTFILDVGAFTGETVSVAFMTNALDNSNYDWLLWGNPRLYRVWGAGGKSRPLRFTGGLSIARTVDQRLCAQRFRYDRSVEAEEAVQGALEGFKKLPAERTGVYAFTPKVSIRSLASSSDLLFSGKNYDMRCVIENAREAAVEDFHQIQIGISGAAIRRGRADQKTAGLQAGETSVVSWQMRPINRRNSVDVAAAVKCQSKRFIGEESEASADVRFLRSMPSMPGRISSETRSIVHHDYALMESGSFRLAFIRERGAFEYIALFAEKAGSLTMAAASRPFSRAVYLGSDGQERSIRFAPADVSMGGSSSGEASLHFADAQTDDEGVEWRYEASFTMEPMTNRAQAEYALYSSEPRGLLHFAGPTLRAGDGGPSGKKEFALFPGLEMLEGSETSSSPRDAAPPICDRLAPHPYKITAPLMAAQRAGVTTGLLWNPLEEWNAEGERGLSACFSSPNLLDGQDNHLMSLFLPTIPDYTAENRLKAETPFQIDSRGVRLRAQLFALTHGTIFDAPALWTEAYGFPEPLYPERTDEESLLLSRYGFMETTWDESTGKSRHCVDWEPRNAPGFATLLWYDYLATNDAAVRQRIDHIARSAMEESGPEGLASPANCHIMRWEFPFYYGHVEAGIEGARRQAEAVMRSQKKDGGWSFEPSDDRQASLGKAGESVLGTCARNALLLLKFARVTGDDETGSAGLRALRFMEQFAVPRGAQGWECPLHAPDILAAAHAVGAYMEAHQLTGDRAHIERAEYWAKTGLPFLYFWNLPDRPGMRYASIPIFGATFHTHSWFGVPVQWNGLVYAYYAQRLSGFSEFPWKTIAEGVTASALHQQWEEGELKGSYPDGFYDYCLDRRGPHLNPENIMANLFALRGHDPDISTGLVRVAGSRIHVSSGARVGGLESSEESFRFTLTGSKGHDTYVYIGNAPPLESAELGGRPLRRLDELSEYGWVYSREKAIATMRIPQREETEHVSAQLSPGFRKGEKNREDDGE